MTDLEARLTQILRDDPVVWPALVAARDLDLPDWWIVSGAIYNTVWNHLTGRPPGYGIKDIDLMYFDPDTSWDAEDREIQRGAACFQPHPPVEIRNQARVHLWYEDHFGHAIPPLRCPRESILNFASQTHAVGVRLEADDRMTLCAPFGQEAIFAMRVEANSRNRNPETHERKAGRCKTFWPELDIRPWSTGPVVTRAADDTDWAEVHALLHRAFAYMEGRIEPPSSLLRMTPETLAAKADTETCPLAIEGGSLLGCVFSTPANDALYVGKLAVEPAHHGRGIGRMLMHQVAAEARAFGHSALVLQTRIELTENHAAFARLGFAKVGETAHPGYDRSTSITMRRDL